VTTNDHVVRYHEHVSTKSYEELIAAFEDAVAEADPAAIADTVTAASNSTDSRQTWESATKSLPGPSGFVRILSLNTGELTSWYGKPAKAKMYIFGNPLIAATMLIHDIRVAGRVPLQLLIYEADNGEARLSYDLPSTLMSRFGNAQLDAAARELDKKLVAFATELTGAAH
jgi:hypothetical protein